MTEHNAQHDTAATPATTEPSRQNADLRAPLAAAPASGWGTRQEPWLWMDGRFFAGDAARIPALSGALHDRRGVWEGVRSYATPNGPRLFALGAHLERLRRGAERLGLSTDLEALGWACEEIVFRNGYDDAHVRVLLFPGPAPGRSHAAAVARPWAGEEVSGSRADGRSESSTAAFGVRATFAVLPASARTDHPPLKRTGPCPQRIFAQRDAAAAGFDEAIFVDPEGRVIDAAGANVCAVIDGEVIAAAHPDALPGITRRVVLGLAGGSERALRREDLLSAEEVFLTGTSAEITPVRELDGMRYADGPVTRRLRGEYQSLVRGGARDETESLDGFPPPCGVACYATQVAP